MNKNVTAFLRAAEKGNIDGLNSYLAREDADVNIIGDNGETALIEAVKNNQLTAVTLLLDQKANLKIKDNNELAAIHYAADRGYFEVLQLLVEKDSTIVNDVSVRGWTALHLAARKGHYDGSGDLNVARAGDSKDSSRDGSEEDFGMKDLNADPKGYFKIAQLLIMKGANINAVALENGVKWTALDLTTNQEIKTLINLQASINSQQIPSSSISGTNILNTQQLSGGQTHTKSY